MEVQGDLISLNSDIKNDQDALQFNWISDEGLLRDEGVTFGITNGSIDSKIDSIREYFNIKRSEVNKELGFISDRVVQYELKKTEFAELIQKLKNELDQKSPFIIFNYPIVFQLVVYLLIAVFNFSLLQFWLQDIFQSNFIIIGLYLLGLFNVFAAKALFFRPNQDDSSEEMYVPARENWKIWFEEFAAPIIVSAFIAIVGSQQKPVIFGVAIFFILSLLFILTGKGLVTLVFTSFRSFKSLTEKIAYLSTRRRLRKELKNKSQDYEAFLIQYEQIKTEHMRNDLLLKSAMEKIDGEEKYKISLFLSEYELARKARERMSGSQLLAFKR